MTQITPELVLVDPVLREAARALLPDPPDCLALRPRPVVVPQPVEIRTVIPQPVEIRSVVPQPVEVRIVEIERRFHAPLPAPLADPPRRLGLLPKPAVVAVPVPVASRSWTRFPRHAALGGVWIVTGLFLLSPLLAFLPAPSSQLPRLTAPGSVAAVRPDVTTDETTAPEPTTGSTARPDTKPSVTTAISWRAVPGAVVYNVIFVRGDERVDVWTAKNRLELIGSKSIAAAPKSTFTWFAYPGFHEGKAVRYGAVIAHGTARVARTAIPKTTPPSGGQVR